jgi:cysteine desulfurase
VYGGGQEGGHRAGTENVAGIVGLSVALELATRDAAEQAAATAALRDRFIEGVLSAVPASALNGSRRERLPNNASLRFAHIEGQTVVLALDVAGFEVSTGSACTSGSLEPSHVLTAIGLDAAAARGTVRFSLGRTTMASDIARLSERLPGTIEKLRALTGALVVGGGPTQVRERSGSP